MDIKNTIKVLKGDESLLFILPKEVAKKMEIANQEWLTFEVRNKELVIKKIADVERSLKTNGMRKDEEIGIAVA
jgi:bifunctional DNA-binding transcriptional regulator/antitoxin component of YhaV-PrlF toxin-antitoxin module